jgi:hypothetical protein
MKPAERKDQTLTVVTSTTVPSGRRGMEDEVRKLVESGVGIDTLRQNFNRFLQSVQAIIDVEQDQVSGFELNAISFCAEIGANGDFKLLGTGVGMLARSGITFTLNRKPPDKPES